MSTQTDVEENVAETVAVDIKQQEENEPRYQINPNQISEDEVKNDEKQELKYDTKLVKTDSDEIENQMLEQIYMEQYEHEIELANKVKKRSDGVSQDQVDFKLFFDSLELIDDENTKAYIEKFKAHGFDSFSALLKCKHKFDKQFLKEMGVEILADQLILLVELKNVTKNIIITKREAKNILTKPASENESTNADEKKNEAKTNIQLQKFLSRVDLTGDIELYNNKLAQHGFDSVEKFLKVFHLLDKQTLKDIGINNIGDQIKILARQPDEDLIFANKLDKYRKNTLNPMHDTNNIYYIYYDDKISGPHTANEIVTMYVYKQIKPGKKLYISSSADDDHEWYKLPILAPFSSIELTNDENKELLNKIQVEFPALYHNLVQNIYDDKLDQIESPPKVRPKEEESKRSSFMVSVRRILGKILLFLLLFVTMVHIIALSPIGIAIQYCLPKIRASMTSIRSNPALYFRRKRIGKVCDGLSWVFMFLGLMIVPVIIVWVILSQFDFYDEIQSWMIAYIAWGTSSFALLVVFVVALRLEEQKSERLINVSKNIIFYIVGVDLGKLDVVEIIDDAGFFEIIKGDFAAIVLMMLPPCASLLPAAIVGFIANFTLEEKFFFKCDREIVNADVCFKTSYGCCEVISSHNIKNTYAFIGGLASNILATWAIIRLSGYLLVNANANFSVYANRRINK